MAKQRKQNGKRKTQEAQARSTDGQGAPWQQGAGGGRGKGRNGYQSQPRSVEKRYWRN